jgi:hypothetical protein
LITELAPDLDREVLRRFVTAADDALFVDEVLGF